MDRLASKTAWRAALVLMLSLMSVVAAQAAIQGVTGTNFNLEAKPDYIVTSDGDSFLMWGYTIAGNRMQYPGPTLIVNQGDVVTINLTNRLTAATSIVFPGQRVTATGGDQGLLTREAAALGGTVTYTFTASEPGTYLYRSGTRADLQVEMGLLGALIVRPQDFDPNTPELKKAYSHSDTAYDREFLLLISEMDPVIHRQVEAGGYATVDMTAYFPTNWFINGRNWPDDMAENFVPWLPTQPYNFQPIMHPGEKVLVRSIGGGVDSHPFHYHGNDFEVIAEDGRMLSSGTGNGPDLAWKATTRRIMGGKTSDVLWTWTGENLGWDIYGHDPDTTPPSLYARSAIDPTWSGNVCDQYVEGDAATYYDPYTNEYCPDHGVAFPVILPNRDNLTFGAFYSGSPFLGGTGNLAPGDPGLNANGGFFYMWHSHTEKELTSNDLWPGGLVSFMIIEHPAVPLP